MSIEHHQSQSFASSLKPASPMLPTPNNPNDSNNSNSAQYPTHPYALKKQMSNGNNGFANPGRGGVPELKLYFIRHFVVLTFAVNTFINAMLQLSFAAVQQNSSEKFGVSQSSINIFSLLYPLFYLPGSILCLYMFKKYELRKSFLFASLIQTLGTLLRYLSINHKFLSLIFGINSISNSNVSYVIAIIGTCLPAIVQPFYTNSPARIAAEWYSVDGRDAATAILSITNIIGGGFGMFTPTIFIKPNSIKGFNSFLMFQFLLTLTGLILTILFHKNKPPTPPSMSQYLKLSQIDIRASAANVTRTNDNPDNSDKHTVPSNPSNWDEIKGDLLMVMRNPNFFWLFVGFGGGLGLFVALATLINQYTAAFHYNTNDAGIFGALMIAGGIIGAVIAGIAMEITKKYKEILRVCVIGAMLATINFIFQMRDNNLIILNISFAILGGFAVPIVAIVCECSAECTYPANEEVGNGLLMLGGSAVAMVLTLIWGDILPTTNHYYGGVSNASTYFVVGAMLVVSIALFMFNGEYKRLILEESQKQLLESQDSQQSIAIDRDGRESSGGVASSYET